MNLRRRRPNDSLDMLLDTMCNTFGGIILLAVLVTLLTSRERHGSAATAETPDMLQRRLDLAQDNLQKALQLQASLQTKADDERWKTQISLLTARQQFQDEIKALRELAARDANELEAIASTDPAERLKNLNAQLAAAQTSRLEAQNRLAASKENAKRLIARVAALEKQATVLAAESVRQLRLPKEHETGKRVIYVIARYGRIYTCRNSDLSRNETDIDWISTSTRQTAIPKQGKGIDPVSNFAAMQAYFRSQSPASVYIAFCVFEDSFPAFIRAKQIAVDSGLSYGWDPDRLSEGHVTFSAAGSSPKPQ